MNNAAGQPSKSPGWKHASTLHYSGSNHAWIQVFCKCGFSYLNHRCLNMCTWNEARLSQSIPSKYIQWTPAKSGKKFPWAINSEYIYIYIFNSEYI